MRRFVRTALSVAVTTLAVAACGSDGKAASSTTATSTTVATTSDAGTGDASTTSSQAATPDSTGPGSTGSDATDGAVSVEAANGTISLPAPAAKIVSLSPTHTEILFAIGAGDQVVAVDDQSNYPAAALDVATNLSGYTPNVEAIATYQPDLVVIGDDFNGLTEQLGAVGITVWSGASPITLNDVYAQFEQLGVLTGHIGDAAEAVLGMQT
ncbi:MAG TPA: ABC transporter substrate-binding protein, partial [Ilumatobacteraceae bacterium]|nr:ABC transporter substrate-binding protein [Ilumatobacteraceae bacterium]